MVEVRYQRSKTEVVVLWLRRLFLRPRFLVGCLVIILYSAFLLRSENAFYHTLGIGFLGFVALLAVLGVFTAFRMARNPLVTSPVSLRITEGGLVHETAGIKTEMGWGVFRGWSETPDYFLLDYGKASAIPMMIPKRAFSTEQLGTFVQCLRRIGATPPKISV